MLNSSNSSSSSNKSTLGSSVTTFWSFSISTKACELNSDPIINHQPKDDRRYQNQILIWRIINPRSIAVSQNQKLQNLGERERETYCSRKAEEFDSRALVVLLWLWALKSAEVLLLMCFESGSGFRFQSGILLLTNQILPHFWFSNGLRMSLQREGEREREVDGCDEITVNI